MKYILIILFLYPNILYSQHLEYDKDSYQFHFYYHINQNNDTIGVDFFLLNLKSRDTLNFSNRFGKKEGNWFEPTYDFHGFKLDSIKYLNEFHSDNLDELKINPKTINGITLVVLNQADSFQFVSSLNFDDMCLFQDDNSTIRQGKFIEEYWFGYLIGNYVNGIRIGQWHFVPCIDNRNSLLKIIPLNEYTNFMDYRLSNKVVSFYMFKSTESGKYSNDKRSGEWKYDTKTGFVRLTTYDMGEFVMSTILRSNNMKYREYEIIKTPKSQVLIKYDYDLHDNPVISGKWDVRHIKNIKNVGERGYFFMFPVN